MSAFVITGLTVEDLGRFQQYAAAALAYSHPL
jgi:hypothetical protein